MSSTAVVAVKSALIRGWRERWSDEQWSVEIRRMIPKGTSGDACQLAEILLEQALIGPSPNMHLMSYLQHAISTQMVSCGSAVSVVVRYTDISRGYCILSLLQLTSETLISCLSTLDDSISGNSLSVGKSVLSLVQWQLVIISYSIQRLAESSPAVEKMHGLSSDTAVAPNLLASKASEVLQQLLSNDSLLALGQIACYEDTDLVQHAKQLALEIDMFKTRLLDNDLKAKISDVQNLVTRLSESPWFTSASLDLSSHLLNISVNVFVYFEAMLSPTNDANVLAMLLRLLQTSEGLSDTDLYAELMRSSLIGITNSVGRPDELKWAAFTFLKLPNIIHQLVKMSNTADSADSTSVNTSVWNALIKLLNYVSLLDLADTKCKCDCLRYLLNEFSNKYLLLSEEQCLQLYNKRQSESLKVPELDGSLVPGGQQPCTNLVLRAESTLNNIFNTLRADNSKNLEGVLIVLGQMISGKSFEFILSAASVTGKLPGLIIELIKFNEMAKVSTGENSKSATQRSLLFDISFLMLCHIFQLYGLEVISTNSEYAASFVIQWGIQCLPEDGKLKSLDLLQPADPSKVEILLGQLGSAGSELKLMLTRWHEVCHNVPYAVLEVLNAWHAGTVGSEKVNVVLDNIKSTMCCLPIVVAAWLCSYVNVSDGETRNKVLSMLRRLKAPFTLEGPPLYYNERSHLMHVILSKMVEGIVPPDSSSSPSVHESESATRDLLVTSVRAILSRGCISTDEVQKMDYLLNVGGPTWYTEHLVRTLLTFDRPEDLHQGVGLIYSLFHADINNLTVCLLNTTLPRLLLLQSGISVSSAPANPVGNASSLKLLTDPRGSALAKLCVMCINLAYTARRFSTSSNGASGSASGTYRGRKRMKVEVQVEDWNSGDDDDENEVAMENSDWGLSDNGNMLRHAFNEDSSDVLPLRSSSSDDAFGIPADFLPAPSGGTSSRRNDMRPRFDSNDLLSKSLARLFRLMHSIMSDKLVSPRSAFIASFVKETLKINPSTARFVLRCMPHSMVNLLVRALPNDFTTDMLLSMCDLTTSSGRRTASKAVCQQARHSALTRTMHR